jgi:hypothetical protein
MYQPQLCAKWQMKTPWNGRAVSMSTNDGGGGPDTPAPPIPADVTVAAAVTIDVAAPAATGVAAVDNGSEWEADPAVIPGIAIDASDGAVHSASSSAERPESCAGDDLNQVCAQTTHTNPRAPYAFSVWTQFTVQTGKRSELPRGMPLVTRMFASSERGIQWHSRV